MNRKLVTVMSACLLQVGSSCTRNSSEKANSQPLLREKAATAERKTILPDCPSARDRMLQASAQTGHHRVFLSWKASTSGLPSDPTVGYCLYRTQTPGKAKD